MSSGHGVSFDVGDERVTALTPSLVSPPTTASTPGLSVAEGRRPPAVPVSRADEAYDASLDGGFSRPDDVDEYDEYDEYEGYNGSEGIVAAQLRVSRVPVHEGKAIIAALARDPAQLRKHAEMIAFEGLVYPS